MKYRWKKNYGIYKLLSIFFLITTIALAIYAFWPRKFESIFQPFLLPELSTIGFSRVENVEVNVIGNTGTVKLISSCYELLATVEASQAESIQRGKEKSYAARPNAHDIMKDIFSSLGIEVLMVKVTELKDNSFYSKLILRQNNTVLNLDARPSDALAIALRVDAPVYINSTLLKEVGKKIC